MHGRNRKRRSYSPLVHRVGGRRRRSREWPRSPRARPRSVGARPLGRRPPGWKVVTAPARARRGPAFASPAQPTRLARPARSREPGSLVRRADGRVLVEIRTADPSPAGVARLRAAGARDRQREPGVRDGHRVGGAEHARRRRRRRRRHLRPRGAGADHLRGRRTGGGRVRPTRERLPSHDLRGQHAHERRGGARPERGRRRGPDDRRPLRLLQQSAAAPTHAAADIAIGRPARPGQPVRVHDTGQGAGRLLRRRSSSTRAGR